MFTPCPDPGSNSGPLDYKLEAPPTELCRPLGIILFKDAYIKFIYDVSNYVISMIKSYQSLETKWIIKIPLTKKKGGGGQIILRNLICCSNEMLTSATKQKQWHGGGSVWVAGPGHIKKKTFNIKKKNEACYQFQLKNIN